MRCPFLLFNTGIQSYIPRGGSKRGFFSSSSLALLEGERDGELVLS